MTPEQIKTFKAIAEFILTKHLPPSHTNIMERTGIKGSATLVKHLDAIEDAGYIQRVKGINRNIILLPKGKKYYEEIK